MDANNARRDSVAMTPEELVEAINQYKAGAKPAEEAEPAPAGEGGTGAEALPEEKDGAGIEEPAAATPAGEPSAMGEPPVQEEKKEDCGVEKLIAVVEEFLAELKAGKGGGEAPAGVGTDAADGSSGADSADGGCTDAEDNSDSSDDKSGSMNNDSADEIFRQRLSICRMGDKLHLDGLEDKSIIEGKKAIVKKVFPEMRLDGKSKVYVDAAYDLAVNAANKRKDVAYQKQQMSANPAPQQRADGQTGSNAAAARQRMIEREGGNE